VRAGGTRQVPGQGVAVVEVLRGERELEDVRISEKGPVVAKKRRTHHGSVWRRGDS
jgi:hypothetical protein